LKKLYKILEIEETSTTVEIKKAYRKLAKKYHPDVCKEEGGEDKFKEINRAYEVLSNPQEKQKYDRFGDEMYEKMGSGGGRPNPNADEFAEAMASFFNQKGNPRQGNPFGMGGNPFIHTTIQAYISIEDLFKGTSIQLQDGTKVKIPPRTIPGSRVRVKGKGMSDGKNTGDLFIIITPKNNDKEFVENDTIIKIIKIDLVSMIFGNEIKYNHYGKDLIVTVPKNTKPGDFVQIPNQGLGTQGSLILHLDLELPKAEDLDEEKVKELFN